MHQLVLSPLRDGEAREEEEIGGGGGGDGEGVAREDG